MRTCKIPNCEGKHEALGYCKKHYRSFRNYGDALFVEQKKQKQAELKLHREMFQKPRQRNRIKTEICSVDGCDKKTRARGLCDMHLKRLERTGSLESRTRRNKIQTDTCFVIGCNNSHKRHGFCSTHLVNVRELKTPYRPKIVKLCGVEGCDNIHLGRGLCAVHYNQWKRVVRDNKLHDLLE